MSPDTIFINKLQAEIEQLKLQLMSKHNAIKLQNEIVDKYKAEVEMLKRAVREVPEVMGGYFPLGHK